mmetsp:Transcript_148204/g.261369  ORF Transcript_148204/g.261369 Transcript_148204/m.261369 type:complete len:221 (-) Transcript_148204:956-1618(-)
MPRSCGSIDVVSLKLLTLSWLRQRRQRSLQGSRRPWSSEDEHFPLILLLSFILRRDGIRVVSLAAGSSLCGVLRCLAQDAAGPCQLCHSPGAAQALEVFARRLDAACDTGGGRRCIEADNTQCLRVLLCIWSCTCSRCWSSVWVRSTDAAAEGLLHLLECRSQYPLQAKYALCRLHMRGRDAAARCGWRRGWLLRGLLALPFFFARLAFSIACRPRQHEP